MIAPYRGNELTIIVREPKIEKLPTLQKAQVIEHL
jgi:hypothetical protein